MIPQKMSSKKITADIILMNEPLEAFPHNQEKFKDFQYYHFYVTQGFSQHREAHKMCKGGSLGASVV